MTSGKHIYSGLRKGARLALMFRVVFRGNPSCTNYPTTCSLPVFPPMYKIERTAVSWLYWMIMKRLSLKKRSTVTTESFSEVATQGLTLRKPGEVYNGNILYPSGITNPANNCYGNSILQCIFNHPSSVLKEIFFQHDTSKCTICSTGSCINYCT